MLLLLHVTVGRGQKPLDVEFMKVAHREVNGGPVVVKAGIPICRHVSGWRIGFGVNISS